MAFDTRPVGMLDSGVGGLSTLKEVHSLLPHEDIVYFADQGHVPYGPRSREEIQTFVRGITRFFLEQNVKAIVIACNAASAGALHHIRERFPDMPFVGMEPAVKPAAERTQSGKIGVITTKATFQGELFASVVERYATDVDVVTQVCPEFVTLVEAGELDTDRTRQVAEEYLAPLLDAGIDHLVLGCTHFPFLTPLLQDIIGPDIAIIDPGPAIARQLGRVIEAKSNDPVHQGVTHYFTSGDAVRFHQLAEMMLGCSIPSEQIHGVTWQGDTLPSSQSLSL